MKWFFRLIFFVGLISFLSCSDSDKENPIPNVPVYLEIDVNGKDNVLNSPLGTKLYTKETVLKDKERAGYGGVLLVCSTEPLTGTLFNLYAFDAACPYEGRSGTRIAVIGDGKLKCTECGTEYYMFGGGRVPNTGPSRWDLKRYDVIYAGANFITFKVVNRKI